NIKVPRFYENAKTMYIYRETIILSALGIIVGFGFGWWLHHFIITSLPPDVAMFDPNMYPLNFVFSALIPAIITAILAIVVHHKIKRINMRSEEHTSELQSRFDLVCRLLLEKKK